MFQRKRGASVRQVAYPWLDRCLGKLRLLGAVLSLSGIAGAAHGGWQWLQDERFFPLRHVQVVGEMQNLHQADIHRVIRHYLGRSFVSLNIGELREVFLQNPWVEQISVQRSWPDTLTIRLQERRAFAHWGGAEMVDRRGVRFQPSYFRLVQAWPQLSGPDGHEELLLETFEQAQKRLRGTDLRIIFLEMDQRRAWRMRFDNGIEIKLGRERVFSRLQRFVDVYPRVLAQRAGRIDSVDMRYRNGFAVRWSSADSDEENTRRAASPRAVTGQSAGLAPSWQDASAG